MNREKEQRTQGFNSRHLQGLRRVLNGNPREHSRDRIIATVLDHEEAALPQSSQQVYSYLSAAVRNLRQQRKVLPLGSEELKVYNLVANYTKAADGDNRAIYHLLGRRLDLESNQPSTEMSGTLMHPGEVVKVNPLSVETIRQSLSGEIDFVRGNPTLGAGAHPDVLRKRFKKELQSIKIDELVEKELIPQPDEDGWHTSIAVAMIFCLAGFKDKQLPEDLDMKALAHQVLEEKA